MVDSLLEIAFRGKALPKELPQVRYLGMGPDPAQIIKDTPSTVELVKIAKSR